MANCRDAETIEGVRSRLGFAVSDTAAPPADPTEELEIDASMFGIEPEFLDTSGIRGTEAKPSERNQEIAINNNGGFRCRPTAYDLERWIPKVTGGAAGAAVAGLVPYTMAEARPCFDAFDRNQLGELRIYRQNRVRSATYAASEKQALSLEVQTVGEDKSPTVEGYTWPPLVPTLGRSFAFPMLQFVVDGTSYRIYNFSLSIQYMIDVQFMNSYTATAFPSSERAIRLNFAIPWKRSSLFELFRNAPQPVTITMDYGTAAARRTIEFYGPKVRMVSGNREPGIPGKPSITWTATCEFLYDETDPDGPNNQLITRIRTAGDA